MSTIPNTGRTPMEPTPPHAEGVSGLNGDDASAPPARDFNRLFEILDRLKEDPVSQAAWKETEEYRRRVDAEEVARLEGEPSK